MRGQIWALAAVPAIVMAAPAAQAQNVRIAMGEEVVFTLKQGAATGPARSAAAPNAFEANAGRLMAGIKPPEAPLAEGMPMSHDDVGPTPAIEPGKLRVRFVHVAGTDHSLLAIYNGYPQALIFRAHIATKMTNGSFKPTDVCLVMPGKPSMEYWPYAIDAVEVGAFELVDWKPEDGVPCK